MSWLDNLDSVQAAMWRLGPGFITIFFQLLAYCFSFISSSTNSHTSVWTLLSIFLLLSLAMRLRVRIRCVILKQLVNSGYMMGSLAHIEVWRIRGSVLFILDRGDMKSRANSQSMQSSFLRTKSVHDSRLSTFCTRIVPRSWSNHVIMEIMHFQAAFRVSRVR